MGIKGNGKIMELHVGNFPAILIIKWKKSVTSHPQSIKYSLFDTKFVN